MTFQTDFHGQNLVFHRLTNNISADDLILRCHVLVLLATCCHAGRGNRRAGKGGGNFLWDVVVIELGLAEANHPPPLPIVKSLD